MVARTTIKQNINLEYQIIKWLKTETFADFYNDISCRVIGQDEGLRLVLSEVRSYIEGLVYGQSKGGNHHNLIIAAGSGAGKTETYRSLRDYFREKLPGFLVTIYDVSNLTAAGFKGQEPCDVLLPYFQAGMSDAYGICFLDELDKKLSPVFSGTGENVNAEVQGQLLTMIEGGDIYNKRGNRINTEHMMFVGLGSFNTFREKRSNEQRVVGIMADNTKVERNKNHFTPLTIEDMIEAGGSWELLGRFSNVINYRKLDNESIRKVIDKAMQSEADTVGVDLNLEEVAIAELIDLAQDSKFGCRFIYSKLHSIIMKTYADALFELPENSSITITINTLVDATYEFVPFSEEDLLHEAEYIEELKNRGDEASDEEESSDWVDDFIGLWE